MKKLFILAVCLLFIGASHAADVWSNNLRFTINNDGTSAIVAKRTLSTERTFATDQRSNPLEKASSEEANPSSTEAEIQILSGDIEIPESVTSEGKSYVVTAIAKDAFWREEITSVIIPQSITSIEESAFMGCEKLSAVILPESLTSIKPQTFSMSGLTSVIIPQGVSTIEWGAFSECNNLISVTLAESVTKIDLHAFGSCRNLKEIHVKATEPPSLGSNVFERVDKISCVVYVPEGSKVAYEKVIDWAEFKDIREE